MATEKKRTPLRVGLLVMLVVSVPVLIRGISEDEPFLLWAGAIGIAFWAALLVLVIRQDRQQSH